MKKKERWKVEVETGGQKVGYDIRQTELLSHPRWYQTIKQDNEEYT